MSSRKILAFPGYESTADVAEDEVLGVKCDAYHLMQPNGLETLHLNFPKSQEMHSHPPAIIKVLKDIGYSLIGYEDADSHFNWRMQRKGNLRDRKYLLQTSSALLVKGVNYHPLIELPREVRKRNSF